MVNITLFSKIIRIFAKVFELYGLTEEERRIVMEA